MEETLLQWNRLLKIDRSRKHANEVHVYLAFEWEILQNKMSRSIWDLTCAVWFSFQVDAFCLAIGLHERKDPKYHLNPLLVSLYPVAHTHTQYREIRKEVVSCSPNRLIWLVRRWMEPTTETIIPWKYAIDKTKVTFKAYEIVNKWHVSIKHANISNRMEYQTTTTKEEEDKSEAKKKQTNKLTCVHTDECLAEILLLRFEPSSWFIQSKSLSRIYFVHEKMVGNNKSQLMIRKVQITCNR